MMKQVSPQGILPILIFWKKIAVNVYMNEWMNELCMICTINDLYMGLIVHFCSISHFFPHLYRQSWFPGEEISCNLVCHDQFCTLPQILTLKQADLQLQH